MFDEGEVVVCIDAKPDELDPLAYLLTEKATYRVCVAGIRKDGQVALAFREIPNADNPEFGYAFCVRRFRKIQKADSQFIAQIRACKPQRIDA